MGKHGKIYVVFLLIIAVLLVGKLKFQKKPEKEALWNIATQKVAKIEVAERNQQPPLVLSRRGDEWAIQQPIQATADKEQADRMAQSLAELKFRNTYGKETPAKEYGLDQPQTVITAWDRHGQRLAELKIGNETSLAGQAWALANGRLCTISSYIKTDFTKDPQSLRDKKLARFDKKDVRSVRIQRDKVDVLCEKTKNEKGEDTWVVRQPVQVPADDFGVDGIVTSIEGLEAKDFVTPEKGKGPKDYGLDRPQLTATLTLAKGDPITIMLGGRTSKVIADTAPSTTTSTPAPSGAPQDLIYTQRKGRDEVVLVDFQKLTELAKDPKELRSRKIWSFPEDDVESVTVKPSGGLSFSMLRGEKDVWQVLEPKKVPAETEFMNSLLWAYADLRAEDFVEDNPKDLKKYGLQPPVIEVTFELVKGGKKVLWIGSHAALDYYAMPKGGNSVYRISEYNINKLPTSLDQVQKKEGQPTETGTPGSVPGPPGVPELRPSQPSTPPAPSAPKPR